MSKLPKIILIIFAVVIQISFLSSFKTLSHLNLILTLSILLLFLNSKYLYYLIFVAGTILDIYSSLPFPIITLSLLAAISLLGILFKNVFTNRSRYSLMLLSFTGTVIYIAVITILAYVAYVARLSEYAPTLNKFYFTNLAWQIIFNILFLAILWSLVNFFKHRLQKTFIFQK